MSINPSTRIPDKLIDSGKLIKLFNSTFSSSTNTRLEGGEPEPEYRPADPVCLYNRIIFSYDYVASALHEIAHWCVAGEQRRKLVDYGYWYEPDGRSPAQQMVFEQVEVKPQAMEWIFATACQIRFQVSADNLETGAQPSKAFKIAIVKQAIKYCEKGLNLRAMQWLECLSINTGTFDALSTKHYTIEQI